MKVVYEKSEGMKVPIKIWGDVEPKAIEQMKNVARLPFIHRWVSVMADGHFGYGCPIGSVVPCNGYILPSLVSLDINCGMKAVKLPLKASDYTRDYIKEMFEGFYNRIPSTNPSHQPDAEVDFNRRDSVEFSNSIYNIFCDEMPEMIKNLGYQDGIAMYRELHYQLGTIGPRSNHFFELQKDVDDNLWLMVHSGSRKFGARVGQYYLEKAKMMCEKYHSPLSDPSLAYFPIDSHLGQDYIRDMTIAGRYADQNRDEMLRQAFAHLELDIQDCEIYGSPHNFARVENHFGKNVWVHRKGATSARKGEIGIIPGSMCTKSYIVRGLGNKDSFMSCSHGSGRNFSRTESKRRIADGTDAPVLDQLGDVQVFGSTDVADEVGSSYKDVVSVMSAQSDLVEIVHELTPLAVLKG